MANNNFEAGPSLFNLEEVTVAQEPRSLEDLLDPRTGKKKKNSPRTGNGPSGAKIAEVDQDEMRRVEGELSAKSFDGQMADGTHYSNR